MRIISKPIALLSLLSLGFFHSAFAESLGNSPSVAVSDNALHEGVSFSCDLNRLNRIKTDMEAYLNHLGISSNLVIIRMDQSKELLTLTLNTPADDTDTLKLKDNPRFAIRDRIVYLPGKNGELRKVLTVSQKEILLALLQHGRLTEFNDINCSINALKDQVKVRQNIVAWSENLNWVWPDGDAAEWNTKYWHKGTPLAKVKLHEALADAFNHQEKYSIGCYTAAKLVMAHSVLDYYRRVRNDKSKEKLVKARLLSDQDPLIDVEPAEMWSFEKDFDKQKDTHAGKILTIKYNVAPKNFVPGDWIYVLNTDPVSAAKTGYEGSNGIYLGRNKFVDYYNDHYHAYSYQEKLNEVYQWRNGVFNRVRDAEKAKPLSDNDFEKLSKSPSDGGLVMGFRVFPINFF